MLPLKKERKVTVTHTELGMGEFMVAIFTWRSDRYFLFSAILYDTYFLWSVFYLLWDVVFDNMSILSRNSFAQRFYFQLLASKHPPFILVGKLLTQQATGNYT